jgi:hypothetical protein
MSNRIDQLILSKYPNQLDQIKEQIKLMTLEYDQNMFLEEDIEESILIELGII